MGSVLNWRSSAILVVFSLGFLMAANWIVAEPTDVETNSLPPQQMQPNVHETTIRKPAGPPTISLGVDEHGNAMSVACSTCHATRPPNADNRDAKDLDEFHQQVKMAHGKLACLACHNSEDYDSLHLADGSALPFTEVLTLCSQCHGPQARDYHHGAHGGMTGHWDLGRGPRLRNNCVDCHDPHSPSFPHMNPTFKPRDRFLDHKNSESQHDE